MYDIYGLGYHYSVVPILYPTVPFSILANRPGHISLDIQYPSITLITVGVTKPCPESKGIFEGLDNSVVGETCLGITGLEVVVV